MQHHHGGHHLTPLTVGQAHHGCVVDGGMLEQHILDLTGGQVLAAAHDHVIHTTVQEQVAVAVDPTGIFGGKPSVVVEHADAAVLTGHLLAPYPYLAPTGRLHLGAQHIADAQFHRG